MKYICPNTLSACSTKIKIVSDEGFKERKVPRCEKTAFGVSDTNKAVQLQNMAKRLKFRILEVEGIRQHLYLFRFFVF